MREERKADLERHVQAVNAAIREVSEGSDEEETGKFAGDGLGEAEVDGEENVVNEEIDLNREEEYVDEDKFTTVTVEAVDIRRDGLHPVQADENEDEEDTNGNVRGENNERPKNNLARKASAEKNGRRKRPKFRYESKAERKITRQKERMGSKARAKLRRNRS